MRLELYMHYQIPLQRCVSLKFYAIPSLAKQKPGPAYVNLILHACDSVHVNTTTTIFTVWLTIVSALSLLLCQVM